MPFKCLSASGIGQLVSAQSFSDNIPVDSVSLILIDVTIWVMVNDRQLLIVDTLNKAAKFMIAAI